MLWIIVTWVIVGFVLLMLTIFTHIGIAHLKGYHNVSDKLIYCMTLADEVDNNESNIPLFVGLFIWPVRIIQFIQSIPTLYEMYDVLEDN